MWIIDWYSFKNPEDFKHGLLNIFFQGLIYLHSWILTYNFLRDKKGLKLGFLTIAFLRKTLIWSPQKNVKKNPSLWKTIKIF